MRKRWICLLMALCMLLSLLPVTAGAADIVSSGTCGENVTWTLDASGVLKISGTGVTYNYTDGSSPFYQNDEIKSVVIESGITKIGAYLFYDCYGILSVVIPESVTEIGNSAFERCYYMSDMSLPSGLTSLGEEAFLNCGNLTSVTIPSSLTTISERAFSECYRLEKVTIPESVTTIDTEAFDYCNALSSVAIPASVSELGVRVFSRCDSLTNIFVAEDNPSYASVDGVLFTKDCKKLIQYPCGRSGAYVIPNSVSLVGIDSFAGCAGLTDITIPGGVETVDDDAFAGCTGLLHVTYMEGVTSIRGMTFAYCTSLESVTIPASVTTILSDSFTGCENLRNIDVDEDNPAYTSIGCALFSKDQTKLIFASAAISGNYVVPSSVKTISDYAFWHCSNLTGITLPEGLRTIYSYAFSDCTGLTSVNIPDSVTKIGSGAFADCENLEEITLPDTMTELGGEVFSNCKSLKSVVIPKGVAVLDSGLFYCCFELESVTIPEGVTTIYSAFSGCISLKGINLPLGLETIGDHAFYGCKSLKNVVIPEGILSIGSRAFYGCSDLRSIVIPKSVQDVWWEPFDGCTKLTDIYFGGSEEDFMKAFNSYEDLLENGSITIHFNSSGPSASDEPVILSPMRDDSTFHYYADHLHTDGLIPDELAQYTYHYDEKWFENSACTYQHELARMSIRMAMAGMAKTGTPDPTDHSNIQALMTQLEFSNLYFDYPQTEVNSIGYAIGSKNIRGSDGKVYSLVSVVVRSAGYFDEWGGNVTLGPSGNHSGFQIAADKVLNGDDNGGVGLLNYISNMQSSGRLTDNVKVWITGYSRGAATANLAAAKLNETFGKDNVFAYCFECPMGTTDANAGGAQYNNIFCIVNPIDLVPKVAMREWGFRRYGKTFYLPSVSNTSLYLPLKLKMDTKYADLLTYSGGTNSVLDVLSVTRQLNAIPGLLEQSVLFDHFVGYLAKNLNRNAYYRFHETSFAQAVANTLGVQGSRSDEDTAALLYLAGVLFDNATLRKNFNTHALLFGAEVGTLALFMRYAHYPELAVAWLDVLDDSTLSNIMSGYRSIFVNCPVDVSVYDCEDNLVAQIINDVPQEIENGISAYVDENGQKVVILPMDMEYRLDVKATDDGTVTYTAADYDLERGDYSQVVSYQEIPVEKGDTLTGTASAAENAPPTYTLTTEDGSTIAPDVTEQGDAIQQWIVQAVSQEGGTATGGGVFINGEFAKVTASPEEGFRFLGWYDGDTCVSEEAEYRFAVSRDIELTAHFETNAEPTTPASPQPTTQPVDPTPASPQPTTRPDGTKPAEPTTKPDDSKPAEPTTKPDDTKPISNPFTDVQKGDYFYDPVLWALTHEPQITDGMTETTFAPGETCTRGQVVTFLWRAMGCEEPKSANNPFTDVAGGDYFYKAVLWAVEKGITDGTSDTTFSPNDPCTRAHVVTFLWRAENKPDAGSRNPFADVAAGEYYTDAVLWAVSKGITDGTSDTTFSPADPCTRGQIVTFLYRDMQ